MTPDLELARRQALLALRQQVIVANSIRARGYRYVPDITVVNGEIVINGPGRLEKL